MDGADIKRAREEMGLGEVTLEALAAYLGVTPAELAAMEAGGPTPDHFWDLTMRYMGELAERDLERERRAHGNGH